MRLRALVIDDSRMMRALVMRSLGEADLAEFEFTEAEDGADGIAKFDVDQTDIVFVDWHMPKMNGLDFVRQVRAGGATDHIPIVMITGERTSEEIEAAIEAVGANGYITKPFTVEQLQEKLGDLIGGIGQVPSGFFGKLAAGGA